ncbi:MAG: DUF1501 domain-containing protein [Gemmataceae bacterium]
MLTLWGDRRRYCDGLSRRDFLRVGALGLGGLSLPGLLRLRAESARPARARAVIMVCLAGGPSHIDTYDPKPDAPESVRGEFKPIRTNVVGFELSEQLPLQAKIADQLALVRSVQFKEPMQHQLEEVYTGHIEAARRPSFGSVISHQQRGGDPRLPRYVSLEYNVGGFHDHEHPRFLGTAHGPVHHNTGGGGLMNLRLRGPAKRLAERRQLLEGFDGLRRDLDTRGEMKAMDGYTAKAFDMLTSTTALDAFDLSKEPEQVRERYGLKQSNKFHYAGTDNLHWPSDKFLLARRLVEAGIPVVTLRAGSWDHHGNVLQGKSIFYNLRSELPLLDRSLYALATDLRERGLDQEVLVLVWGEFGRTPKISLAGRDHWPDASFALFAGGGLKRGQVVGETDSSGARPRTRPLGPQNVLATVYQALGINPAAMVADGTGREVPLLADAQPIEELF